MKLALETRSPMDARADVLVVGRYADAHAARRRSWSRSTRSSTATSPPCSATEKFEGKAGQVTHFYTGGRHARARRVMVVGLGPKQSGDAEIVRRAAADRPRGARATSAPRSVAVFMPADGLPARARAAGHRRGRASSAPTASTSTRRRATRCVEALTVVEPDRRQQLRRARGRARRARSCAAATCLARDLVNEPANDVHADATSPSVREEIAQDGAARASRCSSGRTARSSAWAPSSASPQGSEQPPKFIHLTYAPTGRPRRRVVVIGKGITFDSGGLDLKTADGMLRMKDDMSGAAAVLGIFQALPQLKPPVEVHGLIAATENMPSGTAQRPGDIVRAMNGPTIEIGNTDAEGRLTLADALCYAVEEIKPDEMIDMATLTGACVVALGPRCSGLFATHDGARRSRLLAAADGGGRADVAAAAASTSTGRTSRATSPTSTTSRASAAAAPSSPGCS